MSAATSPVGVLLANVGTPDAPRIPEVRRYLGEFLSDRRVLDTHPVARFLLLRLVILPFRPARSAEAYRKIWLPEGSPLLMHGNAFRDGLAGRLGPSYAVALGMRYGAPSMGSALRDLRIRGCDRIVVFPLYPQHASATTGSALEEAYRLAAPLWNVPMLATVPPFFADRGFISACATRARTVLDEDGADHVLFSFHGLPERQILKSDGTARHCLGSADCCAAVGPENRNCYRAQSFETARLLARALGIAEAGWSVAFQSRLGRIPWIGPATEEILPKLARRGVRRLAVMCPSFVADCLETLEEIGIRAAETFCAAGGESLRLVPSLNGSADWVDAAAALVRRAAPEAGIPLR